MFLPGSEAFDATRSVPEKPQILAFPDVPEGAVNIGGPESFGYLLSIPKDQAKQAAKGEVPEEA